MSKGTEWLSARLEPGHEGDQCVVLGCRNPTMQAAGKGLSPALCRKHVENLARHGHETRPSIPASELAPYLKASTSYLAPRLETDLFVKDAVARLSLLLERAPYDIASRLRGMPAKHRAAIALGRLRRKGTKPARLLAVHLAVSALLEEHPGIPRVGKEYRLCQTAKILHRIQSGYHRTWHHHDKNGREVRIELHKFPRSIGGVLRILGQQVEELCEVATAEHLAGVLALKVKRYGPAAPPPPP